MAERKISKKPSKRQDFGDSCAGESTDEEIPDYAPGVRGLQQAYNDINQIFADVARDYPDFLQEGENEKNEDCDASKGPAAAGDFNASSNAEQERSLKLPMEKIPAPNSSSEMDSSFVNLRPKTVCLGTRRGNTASSSESVPDERPIRIESAPMAETSQETAENIESQPEASKLDDLNVLSNPRLLDALISEKEIRHDNFADEFILESHKEMDQSLIEKIQTNYSSISHGYEKGSGNVDGNPDSTLKIIYKPPIWPHQETLYKRLSRLSTLRTLVLDDSKLNSFRDLGSFLPNLTTLSVMRCNLKSLDGSMGLLNLENLFASDNSIKDPSPLSILQNLRFVDLSDNLISDLRSFSFLKSCSHLISIKLMENDVAKLPNFHQEMKKMIPSLQELRPRILEIHGPEAFDSMEDFDEGISGFPEDMNDFSSGLEDSVGWFKDERQFRAVQTARRLKSKGNKGIKVVPHTVDEMDALLMQLEESTSAISTANDKESTENVAEIGPNKIPAKKRSKSKRVVTVPQLPYENEMLDKCRYLQRAKTSSNIPKTH